MQLSEIQKILKSKAENKTRVNGTKFAPTAKKVWGVRVAVLNDITKRIKEPDFDLVEKLWESGGFEERQLSAKILGKVCKKDPGRALKLIKKFNKDISDWAVCDTLGTQGIRKIVKVKQKEIFELSKRLISSKNFWQRRFAIVLLIELNRQGFSKEKIRKLSKKVENDKEHYIKRALVWLKSELK